MRRKLQIFSKPKSHVVQLKQEIFAFTRKAPESQHIYLFWRLRFVCLVTSTTPLFQLLKAAEATRPVSPPDILILSLSGELNLYCKRGYKLPTLPDIY